MELRARLREGRKSNGLWCKLVLQNLMKVAKSAGHGGVNIVIHADAGSWKVQWMLRSLDTSQMKIYGRNSKGATLEQALHDMITAEVFVAAESSLSNVAALLRGRNKGAIIHPEDTSRSGMVMLGWNMIRNTKEDKLEVCLKATTKSESRCEEWVKADESFWSNLLMLQI